MSKKGSLEKLAIMFASEAESAIRDNAGKWAQATGLRAYEYSEDALPMYDAAKGFSGMESRGRGVSLKLELGAVDENGDTLIVEVSVRRQYAKPKVAVLK